MENRTVKRYPLSKQVSDKLEQMIEIGEYPVDTKIPTEIELMEIFSVSRNTIREAIQSLTSAGVLEVRQGDGTYVRSSNRFNANMNMKYDKASIHDITETRDCLELTLAYLASERRTDEDLASITKAFHERCDSKDSIKENTISDIAFHMAIADASHNEILIALYRSISTYLESHIEKRQNETEMEYSEIDTLHERLYNSIRNKDGDEARSCVKNILKI